MKTNKSSMSEIKIENMRMSVILPAQWMQDPLGGFVRKDRKAYFYTDYVQHFTPGDNMWNSPVTSKRMLASIVEEKKTQGIGLEKPYQVFNSDKPFSVAYACYLFQGTRVTYALLYNNPLYCSLQYKSLSNNMSELEKILFGFKLLK